MSDIKIGSVWVDKVNKSTLEILRENYDGRYYVNTSDGGECYISHANLVEHYELQGRKDDSQNVASSILQDAIDAMSERGKSYDTDGKGVERSMDKVVAMFNTLTGHTLTTEQGWDFMILLKLVRASQGYKHDNYIDGSAYFGLAGEAASEAADD